MNSPTSSLTPREIVKELDRYIVGQADAKRSVAIALRNRWRRQQVAEDLRDEISPKNLILIGPTGVGKTEIARRLAKLAKAPFAKVEASKFTEVGYVGKDVESMVRDLTETAIGIVRQEAQARVKEQAAAAAEEALLDLLLPGTQSQTGPGFQTPAPPPEDTREKFRRMLRDGSLEDREVEVEVTDKGGIPMFRMGGPQGFDEVELPDGGPFADLFARQKKRKVKVSEARELLEAEEAARLIDEDTVRHDAIRRVEQSGIIFLDEIDKIAGRGAGRDGGGPDVSREGVQRDLLPIVEGSNVNTKYGVVRTDHILFIAAGAFHVSKVADLIPELQGRFPIRVELQSLDEGDFVRILSEPENSLTRQYEALLATERVELAFERSGIEEIAAIAARINERSENIGARRLHTVMERLLEEISFEAPDMGGARVGITAEYVQQKLKDVMEDEDLSRYIL